MVEIKCGEAREVQVVECREAYEVVQPLKRMMTKFAHICIISILRK